MSFITVSELGSESSDGEGEGEVTRERGRWRGKEGDGEGERQIWESFRSCCERKVFKRGSGGGEKRRGVGEG